MLLDCMHSSIIAGNHCCYSSCQPHLALGDVGQAAVGERWHVQSGVDAVRVVTLSMELYNKSSISSAAMC
jgi:hypothetical protein